MYKSSEEPEQPFACRNLIIRVTIKNAQAETCNSSHALVFKRMNGIAHITNNTRVLARVPLSSVVITYFLFCPMVFPIFKILELSSDYMQKLYYNSFLGEFQKNALLAVFLPC